jgi:hypothetical protein
MYYLVQLRSRAPHLAFTACCCGRHPSRPTSRDRESLKPNGCSTVQCQAPVPGRTPLAPIPAGEGNTVHTDQQRYSPIVHYFGIMRPRGPVWTRCTPGSVTRQPSLSHMNTEPRCIQAPNLRLAVCRLSRFPRNCFLLLAPLQLPLVNRCVSRKNLAVDSRTSACRSITGRDLTTGGSVNTCALAA